MILQLLLALSIILNLVIAIRIFDVIFLITSFVEKKRKFLILAFIVLGFDIVFEFVLLSLMAYDLLEFGWIDAFAPKYTTLLLIIVFLSVISIAILTGHMYRLGQPTVFIPLAIIGVVFSGFFSAKTSVISRRMFLIGMSMLLFFFLVFFSFYFYNTGLLLISIIVRDAILLVALGKY